MLNFLVLLTAGKCIPSCRIRVNFCSSYQWFKEGLIFFFGSLSTEKWFRLLFLFVYIQICTFWLCILYLNAYVLIHGTFVSELCETFCIRRQALIMDFFVIFRVMHDSAQFPHHLSCIRIARNQEMENSAFVKSGLSRFFTYKNY
jgi:hypothetical protein